MAADNVGIAGIDDQPNRHATPALCPDDVHRATAVEDLVRHWFRAEAVCSPADVSGGLQRAYIWVSHDHQQARRMSTRHLTMTKGVLDTEARP